MSTYLVINDRKINCLDSSPKPYIKVSNKYLPLTTQTKTGRQIIVSNETKTYRVVEQKSSVSSEFIGTEISTTNGYSGTSYVDYITKSGKSEGIIQIARGVFSSWSGGKATKTTYYTFTPAISRTSIISEQFSIHNFTYKDTGTYSYSNRINQYGYQTAAILFYSSITEDAEVGKEVLYCTISSSPFKETIGSKDVLTKKYEYQTISELSSTYYTAEGTPGRYYSTYYSIWRSLFLVSGNFYETNSGGIIPIYSISSDSQLYTGICTFETTVSKYSTKIITYLE